MKKVINISLFILIIALLLMSFIIIDINRDLRCLNNSTQTSITNLNDIKTTTNEIITTLNGIQ